MADAGDMNLGLESLKGFAGKILQAVLGFAGTIIFARVLGRSDFGGFYFLLSLVFIADRPIRGFGQAVEKRYSEAGARKREIAGGAILLTAAALVVAGVVVFALRDLLVQKTNLEQAPVVFVALFVAFGVFYPVQKMLGGEGWISKQTWNDTLRSVLTLPLQLLFVFAGFGAAGMGYGLAAATLLVVPVALYFLRIRPSVPSRSTVASLWSYARYSTVAAFVGKAYDRFDVLLLGTLLTTGAVGNYEAAYKLTVPATFLASVVASGLAPKVSNRHSKEQDVSIDVTNGVSYASLLSIPLFFGVLAIPRSLVVTAYGSEYAGAAVFLVGLALYQLLYSQTLMYQHALSGLDLPDVRMRIDMLTLAFNVVAGVALLTTIGAIGVVVATILAESARYAMSMLSVNRRIDGLDAFPRTLFEQVFAAGVMFVIVEAGQRAIVLRSWVQLGLLVGIGAVTYGVVLLVVSPGLRFTLSSVYRDATS
ncbi:oligosaccharide flippase family protein [Halorussus salinus]|uniref:oligosaccharide flippase family protein n=1 Tax=Halorussus salinus TaxID=1364935 RepID=UPI001092D8A3|nr:oligosaccharide flippase family protein [Halorussus salinus]